MRLCKLSEFADPAELAAEGAEILVSVKAHELEGSFRFTDVKRLACGERVHFKAVSAHFDGIVVAEVLNFDVVARRQDERTVRDGVGADGRDHDGIEVGT